MKVRTQVVLWGAQRASAMVLAVLVLVHLVTMIYAVRNGLSAEEILGRTRSNGWWTAFYALFVLMVSVHAPIGLRTVVLEFFGRGGAAVDVAMLLFGIVLCLFGMSAVVAVCL